MELSQRLAKPAIDVIYSSPLERTLETAEIIAAPHQLAPQVLDDLGEMRFGEWQGKTFSELGEDVTWNAFNRVRSVVRAPGGELMLETQLRMFRTIEKLHKLHEGKRVAVVSHADALRSLILYCLGMPMDMFLRIEISPASVTTLKFGGSVPTIWL